MKYYVINVPKKIGLNLLRFDERYFFEFPSCIQDFFSRTIQYHLGTQPEFSGFYFKLNLELNENFTQFNDKTNAIAHSRTNLEREIYFNYTLMVETDENGKIKSITDNFFGEKQIEVNIPDNIMTFHELTKYFLKKLAEKSPSSEYESKRLAHLASELPFLKYLEEDNKKIPLTLPSLRETYSQNASVFSLQKYTLFHNKTDNDVSNILQNLGDHARTNGEGASAKTLNKLGIKYK